MTRGTALDIAIRGPRAALAEMYDALGGTDVEHRLADPDSPGGLSLLETFLPTPEPLVGRWIIRTPYSREQFSFVADELEATRMRDSNLEYERERALALELYGHDTDNAWRQATWGTLDPDVVTYMVMRRRDLHILSTVGYGVPLVAFEELSHRWPITLRCRWRSETRGQQGRVVVHNGSTEASVWAMVDADDPWGLPV